MGHEPPLIKSISKRQFALYALALERGPNIEPAHVFDAYQVGNGSACGCILLNPELRIFTTRTLRRRVDHCWVFVDAGGPFPSAEAAFNYLCIAMRGGHPPEPLPPGSRRRPHLIKKGPRGTSPEFDLLTGTLTHVPALMALGECYLALPRPDANFVTDFQAGNFASRLFELYLLACFREQGLRVRQDYASPDFWVENNGASCWIEAVTAHSEAPGTGVYVHHRSDFIDFFPR